MISRSHPIRLTGPTSGRGGQRHLTSEEPVGLSLYRTSVEARVDEVYTTIQFIETLRILINLVTI